MTRDLAQNTKALGKTDNDFPLLAYFGQTLASLESQKLGHVSANYARPSEATKDHNPVINETPTSRTRPDGHRITSRRNLPHTSSHQQR